MIELHYSLCYEKYGVVLIKSRCADIIESNYHPQSIDPFFFVWSII